MFWNCSRRPIGEDLAQGWQPASEDGEDRPRILFESPDGAEAHAVWKLLERHGCRTMWCTGPQDGAACVLVAAGSCPLVEEANAVVSSLDLRNQRCQEVARALDAGAASTPVVVMARKTSAEEWRAELPACEVISEPLRARVLLDALAAVCPPLAGSDVPPAEGGPAIG